MRLRDFQGNLVNELPNPPFPAYFSCRRLAFAATGL